MSFVNFVMNLYLNIVIYEDNLCSAQSLVNLKMDFFDLLV